jgi:glycosyltransferase involved in cell wall biosynthesis
MRSGLSGETPSSRLSVKKMNFSLVIPTIGKSPFLTEAVRSALDQTTAFDEILLFGNGVTSGLLLTTLGPRLSGRIRIVCQNDQLPPHASWNKAIAAASHDSVVIIGDDDIFDPSMGEILRRGLEQHPFVAAGYRVIASDGAEIWKTEWAETLYTPAQLYEGLFGKGSLSLLLPGIAFSRAAFTRAGGFPSVPLTNGWLIDTECWVRLAHEVGGIRLLPGNHWRYRLNAGQLGLRKSMQQFSAELRAYRTQHEQLRAKIGLPPLTAQTEACFTQRMMLSRFLGGIRNRAFNHKQPSIRDAIMALRLAPSFGPGGTYRALTGLARIAIRGGLKKSPA